MVPTDVQLPFGKHKGKPLPEVPADYLLWLLCKAKLSSGLRAAIGDELRRRNLDVSSEPSLPLPSCPHCCDAGFVCRWQEDRSGRRRIRAECPACGRFCGWLPILEPWIG